MLAEKSNGLSENLNVLSKVRDDEDMGAACIQSLSCYEFASIPDNPPESEVVMSHDQRHDEKLYRIV